MHHSHYSHGGHAHKKHGGHAKHHEHHAMGGMAHDPAPESFVAHSPTETAARKKKHGGRAKRKHGGHVAHHEMHEHMTHGGHAHKKHGGHAAHHKEVGEVHGEKSHHRADRARRKTGGRVGADQVPFSSGARGTPPRD